MTCDYSLDFDHIDFRKHSELYRIGKGEQGVLLVEPYKKEATKEVLERGEDAVKAESAKILYEKLKRLGRTKNILS